MTILYFTSTGNSLMVAKKISQNLVSIPKAMREGAFEFTDDAIGLVFPVYGLSVPPLILEFLDKAKLHSDFIFAVLTYGTFSAASAFQLQDFALKRNISFSYINNLHMTENYLPGFAMEKQKKPKAQDEKLADIVADIASRKEYIVKSSGFDRFMTNTHQKNYHYKRGAGFTENYSVSESCTGCSTCAKVCPTDNIKLTDGKPIFSKDCLSCFACIQNCPANAISLKGEKSGIRYRNPEIELGEIIKANE